MNNISLLAVLGVVLLATEQSSAQHALTSNGAKIIITNSTTLHVNGDTRLLSGSELKNNGNLSVSGKLTSEQTMQAGSLGTVRFNGVTTQTIDGSETFFTNNMVVDNPGGLQLNSPLRVDGNLLLTNGIVTTSSSSSPLILSESTTVDGASDNSHVNGYVQKMGVGLFSYPVGNGSKFQPVEVNLDENESGFQVKYSSGDAGTASFTTTGASNIALQSYNTQEYWDLQPVSAATGRVTVFWDATNNAPITTSENLGVFQVAHKTLSGWQNEGSSQVSGTLQSGSVTSKTISAWSPFTLGAISQAALPVTLTDFSARLSENQILINWITTQESNASHFEIERSIDAKHFDLIGKVNAAGNSGSLASYSHIDSFKPAAAKTVYYRLRSVDTDGSFSYSRIISVKIVDQGFTSSVYPNPVLNKEPIIVESSDPADQVIIYNVLGRKLPVTTRHLSAGKIQINTSDLTDGIYLIRLESAGKTVYHRLIVL